MTIGLVFSPREGLRLATSILVACFSLLRTSKRFPPNLNFKATAGYFLCYLSPNVLEKHFIPTNNKFWEIKNYDNFLQERLKEIYSAGRKYLSKIIQ